jgi:catechol 2,3-dioxygenase-like lactoylglutathione lyase family enzyme
MARALGGTAGGPEAVSSEPCRSVLAGMTVMAPSLLEPVAVAKRGLGLSVLDETVLDGAEAEALGAPTLSGARSVVVGNPERPVGALRYVEAPGAQPAVPLRRRGWAAAEVLVDDAEAADRRLESLGLDGLRRLRPPAPLASGRRSLRATQWVGAAGEVLYCTEVTGPVDGFELPRSKVAPPQVFAAVLASADLERSRAWLARVLGATVASDHPVAVGVLNDAYGLPPQTSHRISSLQLRGPGLVEVDQHPIGLGPPIATDGSEAGLVAATFLVADPDGGLPGPWWTAGASVGHIPGADAVLAVANPLTGSEPPDLPRAR